MRKQRSSLVETNVNGVKTVLGCSGTIFETAAGAAGYCFAFDVATNKVSAMLALTAGRGRRHLDGRTGRGGRCRKASST